MNAQRNRRPGVDGQASAALLAAGRFFTRWEESDDGRAAYRQAAGGSPLDDRDETIDRALDSLKAVWASPPLAGDG